MDAEDGLHSRVGIFYLNILIVSFPRHNATR